MDDDWESDDWESEPGGDADPEDYDDGLAAHVAECREIECRESRWETHESASLSVAAWQEAGVANMREYDARQLLWKIESTHVRDGVRFLERCRCRNGAGARARA